MLGLLGAWLLSRSVVRPVRRLATASGRLAEGEAGVAVTPEGPRELRELAVSFNDMNAKLAKAQETEQAFLLSVSHELKTPLTSIRGYAEGIGDGTVRTTTAPPSSAPSPAGWSGWSATCSSRGGCARPRSRCAARLWISRPSRTTLRAATKPRRATPASPC